MFHKTRLPEFPAALLFSLFSLSLCRVKKISMSDNDDKQDWFSVPVPPSAGTRLQVSGLSPSTEYQFSILSQNKMGTGPFSEIISTRTLGQYYLLSTDYCSYCYSAGNLTKTKSEMCLLGANMWPANVLCSWPHNVTAIQSYYSVCMCIYICYSIIYSSWCHLNPLDSFIRCASSYGTITYCKWPFLSRVKYLNEDSQLPLTRIIFFNSLISHSIRKARTISKMYTMYHQLYLEELKGIF